MKLGEALRPVIRRDRVDEGTAVQTRVDVVAEHLQVLENNTRALQQLSDEGREANPDADQLATNLLNAGVGLHEAITRPVVTDEITIFAKVHLSIHSVVVDRASLLAAGQATLDNNANS